MSTATPSARAVDAPAYEHLVARGHALVADIASRAAQCETDCRAPENGPAHSIE